MAEQPVWTIKQIYERSQKLLEFMYNRWFKEFLIKKDWADAIEKYDLCNFKYDELKLTDSKYEYLENKLKNYDCSSERKDLEKTLRNNENSDGNFKIFFKNEMQLRSKTKKISYLDNKFTYVMDTDNNYFRCGTLIESKKYDIDYDFSNNKMFIRDRQEGTYITEKDKLHPLLKEFVDSFDRYIKDKTGGKIPELCI